MVCFFATDRAHALCPPPTPEVDSVVKVCRPKAALAQNHRRPCPRTKLRERYGESGKKVTDTDSFGQHLYGHIDSFRYHFRPGENTSDSSIVKRNRQDFFPLLELSWKYKPPRHRTTGPPGKACRSLGQALSKTWAWFVFSQQTVPMHSALEALRGRLRGQGLPPQNKPCPIRPQTLPQTTTDFASTFRRT